MLSQRQIQSERNLIPLLCYQKQQNRYKLSLEAIQIISNITSPLAMITIIGTGNQVANNEVIQSLSKLQAMQNTQQQLMQQNTIWMAKEILKCDHKDQGKINVLLIGGKINQKYDTLFRLVSALATCSVINLIDNSKNSNKNLNSLSSMIDLISKSPLVFINKQSQQSDKFSDYLKDTENKKVIQNILNKCQWKHIFQIGNDNTLSNLKQIVETRICSKSFNGKLLDGNVLIKAIQFFEQKRQESILQYVQSVVENHSSINQEQSKQIQSLKMKLKNVDQKYQSTKKYVDIMKKEHSQQIEQIKERHQEQIDQITKNNKQLKNNSNNKIKQIQQSNKKLTQKVIQLEQNNKSLQYKISSLQTSSTQTSLIQQLKSKVKTLDKQLSLVIQKQQLSRLQLQSLKTKYQQAKKSEAKALDLLDINQCSNTSFITIQNQIDSKLSQMQLLSKTYENKLSQLQKQYKSLKQTSNQKQLQYNILVQQKSSLTTSYQSNISTLQTKLKQQQSKYNQFIQSSSLQSKQQQSSYQKKIQQLQQQLTQFKQNMQMTICQNKNVSQSDVLMIKGYYEQQKILRQKKLHDEKQRLINKYKSQLKDMETRYQEEIDQLIEQKQEAISNISIQEQQFQNILKSMESDQIIKTNQILSLNQKIKYLEQTYQCQRLNTEGQNKQVVLSLQEEISILSTKYKQSQQSIIIFETKSVSLNKSIQLLTKQNNEFSTTIDSIQKQLVQSKTEIQRLHEQLRKTSCLLTDQTYQNKIQQQKISILNDQYKQYSQGKIKQLEEKLQSNKGMYEKEIEQWKKKLLGKGKDEILTLQKQKIELSQELQQSTKQWREKQICFMKKISQNQRIVSGLNQKLNSLQKDIQTVNKQKLKLNEQNLKKINDLKDTLKQNDSKFNKQIQQLTLKLKQLEVTKTTLEHQNQKSKALFQGKFTYLQNQRQSQKQQHQQTIKRMTNTIQFLKTKEKSDSVQQSIKNIQSQYVEKIKQLGESKLKQQLKDQQTIRLLTLELKTQKQKSIQLQTRSVTTTIQNKPDKHYQQQIQRIKQQKQSDILSHQRSHLAEKQTLRSKIRNLEQRISELERGKSYYLFQQQKQKAKWNLQRDHLKQTNKQLQQTISSLKYSKQKLQKQNENIKVEKRKYKNMNMSVMGMKNSMMGSFSKWQQQKMKSVNVKDYSIFGSDSKTPDVLSNSQDDSIIDEKFDQDKVNIDE